MPNIPLIENGDDYKELFTLVWWSKTLKASILAIFPFSSGNNHIILYSAEWADQCSQILAVMQQLSKQEAYRNIKFLNVAIEELPEVAQQHEIEAVPTVRDFSSGSFYYSANVFLILGHLL